MGMNRKRIEDWAPVRAHCAGEPVFAFGFTYVYTVSPDFVPDRMLQEGNHHPWQRLQPKKSWEIGQSRIGSTPAREPRTAANESQPLLPVHLIDGDLGTMWCSRGRRQSAGHLMGEPTSRLRSAAATGGRSGYPRPRCGYGSGH